MDENNQIEPTFLIKDMDTLRVIADPLRAQILETLIHDPLTVRQVAEKLGLAPSKLYYHINLLEKHGFVRAVDSRVINNIIEKYYQATARNYDVDRNLLSFSIEENRESLQALLSATIDATREDLLRSLQARVFSLESGASEQDRQVVLFRQTAQISEQQASEMLQRIREIIAEFEASEQSKEGEDQQLYALMLAFYPSFYYPQGE